MSAFSAFAQKKVIRVLKDDVNRLNPYTLVCPGDSQYIDFTVSMEDMGFRYVSGIELKDSVPDGDYEIYINNSIARAGSVRNGRKHGAWRAWYEGVGSSSLRIWNEEHGSKQGYERSYTDNELTYYVYWEDNVPLFSESVHNGRAAARMVLSGAKNISFGQDGSMLRTQTKREVWEEYGYNGNPNNIWYWQPQEQAELVISTNGGRTTHWRYRNALNNKRLELDAPDRTIDSALVRKHLDDSLQGFNGVFVCRLTETLPVYPGGEQALAQFIRQNLKYPADAKKGGWEGKVYVSFTVRRDGSIADAEVVKPCPPLFRQEALRVVRLIHRFEPARKNGKRVAAKVMLPISFSSD